MKEEISKADVKAVLKDLGFGFVKMKLNSFQTKTHSSKQTGVEGGQSGPMTATTQWKHHNQEVLDRVTHELLKIATTVDTNSKSHDLIATFDTGKEIVTYNFDWMEFPTYAHNEYDEGYKTYWLVVKVVTTKKSK